MECANVRQYDGSRKCEREIKSQHDWNCIDPKPVWPAAQAPAAGRCFCHDRNIGKQYWDCFYREVIPCAKRSVDLDWIYGKSSYVTRKQDADIDDSGRMALARQ
jgi:hypothetical protein